ncbi:MAG: RNA polymerase sigma factor [Verrucomicrobiota bacterium]
MKRPLRSSKRIALSTELTRDGTIYYIKLFKGSFGVCTREEARYIQAVKHVEEPLIENLQTFVAFARKRVGDPHLAEDIVQDSLLKALRSDRKPAVGEDVIAWFYRILRHSIIDLYRRGDVRKIALEKFEKEFSEEPDAASKRIVCQCVKRLLPELSEQYRDLIQRIDLDGASPKDTAVALGLTTNNVTVRLHRARQKLRAGLEQTCKVCSKHGCLDCTCDMD